MATKKTARKKTAPKKAAAKKAGKKVSVARALDLTLERRELRRV